MFQTAVPKIIETLNRNGWELYLAGQDPCAPLEKILAHGPIRHDLFCEIPAVYPMYLDRLVGNQAVPGVLVDSCGRLIDTYYMALPSSGNGSRSAMARELGNMQALDMQPRIQVYGREVVLNPLRFMPSMVMVGTGYDTAVYYDKFVQALGSMRTFPININ